MSTPPKAASLIVLTLSVLVACSGSATSPSAGSTTTSSSSSASASLPSWYSQFGNGVQVSLSGAYVVLQTNDLPDHPSPYWGVGKPLYEAPFAGMQVNPNAIITQNLTFRVPVSPQMSSTPSDTPLGAIGIAVNGVVFFNQYAAGRQPLTGEIYSFDRFNGHPQQSGQYHYHVDPLWLTQSSESRMIGVLSDGFAVYGMVDANGVAPTDLDVCHGHVGTTPEFATATYHYHVTSDAPYISGCFRGTAGTVG